MPVWYEPRQPDISLLQKKRARGQAGMWWGFGCSSVLWLPLLPTSVIAGFAVVAVIVVVPYLILVSRPEKRIKEVL